MAKKLKDLIKDEDIELARAVRTSAQQIWQAGLGAFAKAQEEGGRVFNKLVEEGAELQKRSRSAAEDRLAGMADTVGKQASGSWDRLEQVFEDRVSRALGSIGVPTRKDMEALARQVAQLSEQVAQLASQRPAPKARAKTAAHQPAGKAAARKAAPRKRAAPPSVP